MKTASRLLATFIVSIRYRIARVQPWHIVGALILLWLVAVPLTHARIEAWQRSDQRCWGIR